MMDSPNSRLAQDADVPFSPGDLIVSRNYKYDGSAHWVTPATYLGSDEWGHWSAHNVGTFVSRPGFAFHAERPALLLIPRHGDWVATYYRPESAHEVTLYIDIVTGVSWRRLAFDRGWEVELIDMDLDVVVAQGHPFVDDEDEFAEHQKRFGYRADLVEASESACAEIFSAVKESQAPFAGEDQPWWRLAVSRGVVTQ